MTRQGEKGVGGGVTRWGEGGLVNKLADIRDQNAGHCWMARVLSEVFRE